MYLAIDVGGTKTLFAVFDTDGNVVFQEKIATNHNYSEFLLDVRKIIEKITNSYQISDCCCAGPGLIDHEHGVVTRLGSIDWQDIPLKHDLQQILPNVNIYIENDAKLAGLSEAHAHNEYKKVLYLTVSTGIGGGVIINGVIDPVLLDIEPGQMMLVHNGQPMKWESFASGKAIKEKYGRIAAEIDDSEIWSEYVKGLAIGIQELLAIIHPDVVIIGGGVGAHFEKFSSYLDAEMKKLELPMVKIPPIIQAERPEEAVIYGCYEYINEQVR